MKGPLNLASRPFRNERLPALVIGACATLLVAATIAHGYLLWSLTRGGRHRREGELRALAAQEDGLRREMDALRKVRPAPATLAEWRVLKELVDRRAFSWTGLFSRLETILPPHVRISSIAPSVQKGVTNLEISAYVESAEDGLEFLRRLQQQGDFREVFPTSAGEGASEGRQFHYTMQYVPFEHAAGHPAAAGLGP
jgi:Tfp pilus assembly protein PilN